MNLQTGGSGALFDMSGTISNNATWNEQIYFLQSGVGMDLTGLLFQLQFRECVYPDSVAASTLSTVGGELVITNDDNDEPTILEINVPYTAINSLVGDYQADLVSKDGLDKITHWASGIVTFQPSPVAF